MSAQLQPVVGQWYREAETGRAFVVAGSDANFRRLELQSVDGEVEEIETDAWLQLNLTRVDPPEIWEDWDDNDADELTGEEMTLLLESESSASSLYMASDGIVE